MIRDISSQQQELVRGGCNSPNPNPSGLPTFPAFDYVQANEEAVNHARHGFEGPVRQKPTDEEVVINCP